MVTEGNEIEQVDNDEVRVTFPTTEAPKARGVMKKLSMVPGSAPVGIQNRRNTSFAFQPTAQEPEIEEDEEESEEEDIGDDESQLLGMPAFISAHAREPSFKSSVSLNQQQQQQESQRSFSQVSNMCHMSNVPTELVPKDPRRPTKFGAELLPKDVMAEFSQKQKLHHVGDVGAIEKAVQARKLSGVQMLPQSSLQRKCSMMSSRMAESVEGGDGIDPETYQAGL